MRSYLLKQQRAFFSFEKEKVCMSEEGQKERESLGSMSSAEPDAGFDLIP